MSVALNQEIQEAINNLGKLLRDNPLVGEYLEAVQRVQQDGQLVEMETRLYSLYEQLIARQQSGEQLSQEEVESFNHLRQQVFNHPLIAEREARLKPVKAFFAEVATEISAPLGVDYTILAQ
jgi:cell fate (sporulation/competence/biofilm development) regulator YlbF (YheA/YmcA/DUF963 family)